MFYVVGYQKEKESKLKMIATTRRSKAEKTFDKFLQKKYFRIALLKYGRDKYDYSILKQAENGEDRTFELLV